MQKAKILSVANRSRWVYRIGTFVIKPIVIFVSLQIFLAAVTGLWVIWFINQQDEIVNNARALGNQYIDSDYVLAILIIGCILLGMILVGTVLLFAFAQRQSNMINQQRNFVSSVTHELRSPLASLQLGFETLQNRDLSPTTQKRILGMIGADIERLGKLIDQILVSARLDRGLMVYESSENFALRELFEKVAENAAYLDPLLHERLTLQCPHDVRVETIRPALALIVGNLLENAIKYSPKNAPISISANVHGERLEIVVEDQGFGLSKRDQKRIFKMFHRADIATKKAIPGTGLGLYIVRSAVLNLGGRVWAASPGVHQGSRFHIMLPVRLSQ